VAISAYDAMLAALFSLWLAFTVVKQFRYPLARRLTRRDIFNMLPIWTFFAPNPGKTDLHILFRDVLRDGSMTAWQEVLHRHKRRLRLLWNPAKREDKIVRDCVTALRKSEREIPTRATLFFTVPYMILLGHVLSASVSGDASARQFLIVEEGRFAGGGTVPVFMSSFHSVTT
jgi:hypothetical protein